MEGHNDFPTQLDEPKVLTNTEGATSETPPVGETTPPQFDFNSELVKVTGGRAKSVEELQGLFSDYDAKSVKAQELQGTWDNMNPRAKKLHDLSANGATDQDIERWLSMQSLKVDSMSDVEKMTRHIEATQPRMSKADIENFIADEYGDDLESLTGKAKSSFLKAVTEAESYLREQIVSAENPEAVKRAEQVRTENERYAGEAVRHFDALKNNGVLKSLNVSVRDDVKLDFTVPDEVRNWALEAAKTTAIANKTDLKSEDIMASAEGLLLAAYGKPFIKIAFESGFNKGKEAKADATSGKEHQPSTKAIEVVPNSDWTSSWVPST
jgi:hypothetical protein